MPEWFKSGGNVREQHSNIAAGVATEYETKDDGHYISAHIVDPVSIKKVEAKVLKGFSIGIKGPRVVRDNKAANGRIIDGQIVEVSLVDRPANPSCQLVLAKSVGGESTLTQVEELIEIIKEEKPSYKAKSDKSPIKETPVAKSVLAETILELVKSANGDTVKFDQAAYDTARRALAQLIITQAGEMADGSDERDDIEELIDVIKHLFRWKDGEDEENETDMSGSVMQMSAKDAGADCDCDGCAACKADGGCDKSPCNKCAMAKSATAEKCLECGCHKVDDAHGRTDVTTAVVVSPDDAPKSAEGDDAPAAELVEAELPVETPAEDVSAIESLDDEAVAEIVEKAVKSATESVKAEIAELRAATKAAEAHAVALESELVTAKSAAVAGGPKRTGRTAVTTENELLTKATEYRVKAAATSDPILVKGYKALEKEYLSKAGQLTED
jgi:hypothetical protein